MEIYKIGDFLKLILISDIQKRFKGDYGKHIKDIVNNPLGTVGGYSGGFSEIIPRGAGNDNSNLSNVKRLISSINDIILNKKAMQGSSINWQKKFSKHDVIKNYQFSSDYSIYNFKSNQKIINEHYFFFALKWNWFYQYIFSSMTGATNLTTQNFFLTKIKLPSLEKQQQLVDKLLPIYKVYHNICRILDKLDDYYRLIINLLFPAIDSPKQYLEKINAKYLFTASYLHKVGANYDKYSKIILRRSNSCPINLNNYTWTSEKFNLHGNIIKRSSMKSTYKFSNRLKVKNNDLLMCKISNGSIQIGLRKVGTIVNMFRTTVTSIGSLDLNYNAYKSLLIKSHMKTTYLFRRNSKTALIYVMTGSGILRTPFYISEKLIEELIPTFTSCYQNSYTYFQKQKRIYFNYFKALLHKNFVTKEYCPIPKVSGGLS